MFRGCRITMRVCELRGTKIEELIFALCIDRDGAIPSFWCKSKRSIEPLLQEFRGEF